MTYLITQTFILLLVAALLGLILGWYLTRRSAATARSALLVELESARAEVASVRSEHDAAVLARDHAETERRLKQDEVIDLEARLAAAEAASRQAVDTDRLASLEAELAECRSALEAFQAPASSSDEVVDTAAIASAAAAAASGAAALLDPSPAGAGAPGIDDGPDDLRQIKGIGPKIATILNELGIRSYSQIAAWTPDDVASINAHLKFKGRVEREAWIEQATALVEARAKGG
jgi:predicted flap endonuclease-1-like 5' DNA nuclease